MTIDEATELIKKYNACNNETPIECVSKKCEECEHKYDEKEWYQMFNQLVEWLELLKWYEQGMEDIPSESGVMPKDIYHTGYDKGRTDEREDWECAVADKIIKHGEDIYVALPEVISKIRNDTIDECIECAEKINIIESDWFIEELKKLKENKNDN